MDAKALEEAAGVGVVVGPSLCSLSSTETAPLLAAGLRLFTPGVVGGWRTRLSSSSPLAAALDWPGRPAQRWGYNAGHPGTGWAQCLSLSLSTHWRCHAARRSRQSR